MGVPILRIIVFGGLYWDPLTLGNYHIRNIFPDSVLTTSMSANRSCDISAESTLPLCYVGREDLHD